MAAAPPGAPILYPKPRAQLDYITIYWQPAPGTVSSYTITCAPISYSRTVPANFNQIELHGLSTNIEYAFSIYATNIYGNGPARNFVPINVGKDPSNPFQVVASTASNTSAYIRWNYSSLYAAEAPTDHFIITAIPSTTGAAPKTADWTFSNQKDLLMPNLSTGVTYGFLVQAANDIRYSSYSTLSNYIRIQIYWYPTQLDDIQCWYDASELIYANGQTIKSWPDRAERSFLFNPSTYVYPTVRVAGLNGLNVTTFNQLAGLQLSPLLTSTNQSFFAVARQSGGANFKVFGSYTSDQYIGYFGGKKQIISLDEQPMSIGLANSDTQWDLISLVLQKNITNDFYWYGSPIETNETTNIVDSLTFNGIGNASNCEIAEVIFYNRNVITEERQVVEGYLAWKWGLYSKLPPNHPWSAYPPPVDYTTKRPPRPFTSVTATDPTPSTFTINWLGGDSLYDTPTTYTFLINGVPTIPISVIDGKAVFDNLDPGTDYTVTIIATNKFGSVTSNPITATTTPSQPVINSFTNVTVSTITVGWTGGIGATSYIYYFNGVPIIPSIDNGTTNKTATFTGLNPDTFYTIIVVAVNRVGVNPSEPSDTQLAPAIPIPQVDLNLPFSLNLSWAPCPGAQSYTYTIVPSAGVNTSLTGTTIYFSNLETDTEYIITITAINGYGQSTSIPLPVTTIPADLSTILTQTTCSSFTIIWAPLASFVYSYSLVNNSISTFGTGVYTPLTISSLRPNQTYTIQVWETKSTTVIYASSLTVITYPNPTSSISVSGINTNGFTLNWKGGDQASSFVFSVDGGTTLIRTPWSPDPYLTSQSGSAVFTNLSTGATFNNIIIYSENIGGVSFSDAYPTVTLLPSACANPTPSLFSQRTFTVNWQRPLGATSIVYGGSLQPNFTNLTLGPAVYTSLSPGTVYSTTYTPYNLNGTQAGQTTSLLVKTQADKPTNFQHSAPTLSTLFLTWSGVFGAEYYKYVINNVLSPISTSESSITVSSISTNTDYNIAIISYVTGWSLGQIILSTYSNYTKFITQPAIPTGQKFSSVTMSSFELTWDPVPSTVYTILVGSTIFGPYTSPATISSLTGNSTYTITIIATNPGGSTPSTMTITTGPVAPYNISTTYVTDHEMLITWSGADGASSITIFYGPFSTTVAEPVNQPFRLYPLSSNTTYIITLDANSPISVTRSGSISPATGPGIASGLAASNVQNAQFTLSWSGAEGASSLLFHYNNLSTLSTPAIMSPTIIRNLSANTTYIVSIDSINPIFTTSSNQISVRTGPVPAGNISTQNITDTQIEITWTGTDGASSITIYYGPFSTTVAAPVIQPYIIRPLSSNTTYIISIDATNPIFNTSSQQITSRTGPTKVTGIVASNVQNSQFTLSWSGADGASSLLFHYNNLSTLSTPAIQSPTTITNLSANTVYIVSIDAINPIFTTSSNTISVLTGPVPASNISTGNITDTTVDVYWEGTEGASSIVIHYGPDIYVFPAPVNQPVTVSSLSSNKEYIISVDAVSPIFITSSQQITTKTGPGIVTGISASNITNSQFNLAWSGAQGATSLLFHYNDLSTLSSAVIPSPTLIRNLSGNTTYIVSIDAINSIFTTSSKTISVLTGPVTPYNLVPSEITNIKFLLAWSGGDGASSYTFHWGTSSLVYNAQTISNPVLISNLSTGTVYDVYIEATSPIYNAISDHYLLSTLTIIPTTAFTSITATNITDTTLLLNWTGAIHASSFYFYYAGLTVVSSATTLVSTNNILVTGLTDSAIYSFYIQGVNLLSTTTSNTIIVQMGPAPATNLVISNITDTQLTVGWQGARGASTLMLFCGPQNFTSTPPIISPYTFTGLSPYTSYPVRIDSITHVYTNRSQTVTVRSGPEPYDFAVSNVQSNQLTLSWTGGLGASSIKFSYGSQFIISSASVTSPLIISGLTPNTNYPITMDAINSTYTTPTVTFNQITGPAPATNITITNIQDKQFQVNWLNAQGASSLTFRYNSQTLSVNTPVTSPYTISSLQPFTSYTVSIDAVNHIFTTSSMQTTITTGPGQITNLATSNVQNSQLTLAWSGGLGASSLQFAYGSQFIISSASVTSPLTITGLTGNTNYPISVQAINSTYTTSSLVINQITGPAPATNITITNIQDKQFQVNWLNAQGASSLTFRYNSQTLSVNTPVSSPYTISSLQPFTSYTVSIDAINHIFTTSSMQTTVTTGPGQITNLATSNVQNSQLTLSWSGGLGASSLQFTYGSQFIISSASVTSPLTITGLTGNTNYPISVQAINSTYTTSSLVINQITGPAPATNITITGIQDQQLQVNWLNAQGASSLTFRYNSQTISVNTPVTSPYTISNLTPFTNYIISIDAVNHIFTTSSMQTNATTGASKATGLSYSDVTDTTFKVYWTGGTQGASSIQFVYNSNSVTYPISQTSPVTLTNLTGNTTYTTYINAINSTYTTSSNSISVLTGPVTPFNLTATNITNSLFKIGWSGGQGASSYTFRYNTQQLTYNATTVANPLTIVSLSTATGYNVYIEATNSIYNAVSQVYNVSTLAVIPPLPATNITAGSITANTFLLYWQGAENASSLTFFIGGLTPIVSSATVNSPILVTGLTQNTPYPVYIDAVNILNIATSNTVTVTTAPNLPNPSLVQNTLSASTFQATWTNSSGITYSYTLNGGSATNIGQNPAIPYTVTSLTQNTPYTFTLIATNNASQSSQSSFQVTTIPSPPNASTQTINQNSFIITWTPVGGITYYYKLNGGGLTNAGSPNLTINSGIVGDTYYPFVLIATGLTTSISTYLNVLTLPVPQIPSVYNNLMYQSYFQIYFTTPVGGNSYYYTMNNGGPSGYINPYNTVAPLNPNTNYTLTLSTTNASGSSNASMNFTTGPQAPDNLYIDNIQTNQFMLHWTGYHNPSNYKVYYDSDAGQRQQDTGNGVTYLTCNQNLSPSGYYGNIYVIAQNQYGFSNESARVYVFTNPLPPNPSQVLSQTNCSSLQVTWTQVGNTNYNYAFSGPGGGQNNVYPPVTLYNLPFGQTWNFQLYAVNPYNNTQINPVNITVGTAPGPATNLQFSNLSNNGTINLSWQGAQGANKAVVAYWSSFAQAANGTQYFDNFSNNGQMNNLAQNTYYSTVVSTINSYGTSNSVISSFLTYPEFTDPFSGMGISYTVQDTSISWSVGHWGYDQPYMYPGSPNQWATYWYSMDGGNTKIQGQSLSGPLSPQTTYNFTLYMKNATGFSKPSPQQSQTTTRPRPTAATILVTGASCSTLSLSWSNLQNADAIDVYVNNSQVTSGLPGGTTTYLAFNLTQATFYSNIYIMARNNAFSGSQNQSNVINGLTAPLQPTQNLPTTSPIQIGVIWTAIGGPTYYYSFNNGSFNTGSSPLLLTSGINPYNSYPLVLQVQQNGLTASAPAITLYSGPTSPTLSYNTVVYNRFNLSWTTPSSYDPVGISYYIVRYNTYTTGNITGTTTTITSNVSGNNTYNVYVTAYSMYGSSISNTVTFQTPVNPPPQLTSIRQGQTSFTPATTTGTLAIQFNGYESGAGTYTYSVSGSGVSISNQTFTGGGFNIPGCTYRQNYNVTVNVQNASGSNTISGTFSPHTVYRWVGPPGGVGIGSYGVAVDKSNNYVYMTNTSGNVYNVYPNNQLITGGMNNARGCVVRNGILYVVDSNNNRVITINLSNNSTGVFGSLPGSCEYIAIDSTGNVYVGSNDGNIYKIPSGGGGYSQYINAGSKVRGMDMDSNNNLYYTTSNDNWYNGGSTGVYNTNSNQGTGGGGGGGLQRIGCAVQPNGSAFYWTDRGEVRIKSNQGLNAGGGGPGSWESNMGDVSAFADNTSNFRYLWDCKLDATGKFLYAIEQAADPNDFHLVAIVLP